MTLPKMKFLLSLAITLFAFIGFASAQKIVTKIKEPNGYIVTVTSTPNGHQSSNGGSSGPGKGPNEWWEDHAKEVNINMGAQSKIIYTEDPKLKVGMTKNQVTDAAN